MQRPSPKRNTSNRNIPKRNVQQKNIQQKNIQYRSNLNKGGARRKSYHGQKLFGCVMMCCLLLFLYAFLIVEGYWSQQGDWPGGGSGAPQGFGTESLQGNDQGNGAESEKNSLAVHFIDVGQGDATLIKCDGEAMLIDAAGEDKGTALRYYLRKQGVEKVDYLVLTHPDSDHIGSADVILTKFPVENVIMSYYERESTSYRNLKQTLEYKRITPQIAAAGQSFEVGSARCTLLGPLQEYETPNDASVILLVEHGENRFLFTGDAESKAEEALLKYAESLQNAESLQDAESQQNVELLHADVYKAGHHGSSTSSTDKFLDAVKPTYAVISCAKGNDYGHPHRETLERFGERNIQVYRTDEQGTIVLFSDGEQIIWNLDSYGK